MKEKQFCRACKAPVEHSASAQGAAWVLCAIHAAAVGFDRRARAVIEEVAREVAAKRVVLVHDADGAGWGHPVPPEPRAPRPPITLDDGSPRYRDWDQTAIVGSGSDGDE